MRREGRVQEVSVCVCAGVRGQGSEDTKSDEFSAGVLGQGLKDTKDEEGGGTA